MVNRKFIADATTDDLVRRWDEREPGFKARVDARVARLALARQVKKLRELRHMTQAELAVKAGTGQASIARIESGKAVPKLDLLTRIASALSARMDLVLKPLKT